MLCLNVAKENERLFVSDCSKNKINGQYNRKTAFQQKQLIEAKYKKVAILYWKLKVRKVSTPPAQQQKLNNSKVAKLKI